MNKLLTLEGVLKPILEEHPETRDDDMLLYAHYVSAINPNLSLDTIFSNPAFRKSQRISACNSIIRVRRMLQVKFEHLKSSKDAKKVRIKGQQKYVEYVRESKKGESVYEE